MSEQPGGGFFRKVGSLFYENEPDSGEPVTPAQAPLTHAGNSHPVNCAADPEIVKRIEVALKLAGANALASVLDLCESMASIIPDETTRFKAALAAAKKQGASATVIVADFDRANSARSDNCSKFQV